MNNLLTWHYWFNLRPEPLMNSVNWIFIIILLVLLVLTVISALRQRRKSAYKGVWKRIYAFSLGNFLIGAIIFFFNYERAIFLSARFWFILWLITILIWFWPIIKSYRQVPMHKKRLEEEKEFKKYIP